MLEILAEFCGKITQVLYSCLKNNEPYDPFKHASKMGVILDGDKVKLQIPSNLEDYERQADELADDDVLEMTVSYTALNRTYIAHCPANWKLRSFQITVMG